ncbi:MAG: hypothetical protein HY681_15335 [Chloroflexi bacterium]|nr:hypothetical protein [Chloroflexota bacterium]
MEKTPLASLFPLEDSPATTVLPDPPALLVTAPSQQPAASAVTLPQSRREQLDALGLKPGSAYVYHVNGKLYAWGDFTHCPAEDIAHNIRSLAGWLRKEPRLWGIGKAYDAEVYRMEKAGDWDHVRRQVRAVYKERWHLAGDDGSLTRVEEQEPEHQASPERRPLMEEQTNVETRKNGHKQPGHLPPAESAFPLLWDGLPPAVAEKLAQPLDPSLVSSRKGRSGRSFAYLEGHAAIAQANRIFGYGGGGYELVGDINYREIKSVNAKTGEVSITGMYCATVRVTVPGVPPRTDVGCQAVAEDTPDGHDTAFKGAVTDALKRALRSFGDQFGNALYGDGADASTEQGRKDALLPSLKDSLLHLAKAQGLTEPKLLDAVKKKTGKALEALAAPELANLLQAMARKQAAATPGPSKENSPDGAASTNGSAPRP